jgi:hypothetical protein
MVREDVVQATREARFHIHAIATVDEGLALLSDRPAGEPGSDGEFPRDSFNGAVEQALAAHVRHLRELRAAPIAASASDGSGERSTPAERGAGERP